MNGITIIEEHLCRVVELPLLICVGIFITLLFLAVLAMYRYMYKISTESKDTKITAFCCSVALIILYIVFWTFQIHNYNKTHMEYTVIVNDSVSFNDFHEKYEIISIDGNEYRVKEK